MEDGRHCGKAIHATSFFSKLSSCYASWPAPSFAVAVLHVVLRCSSSVAVDKGGLCVCVCVFSSHPFWTSSSLDVPAGVTQEEGHTGFLIHLPSAVRALIFVARRIQPFLSLVDREVEFRVLTN